ncbi:MAG: dihydropteroate synthase [Deltaproteobacteria bacterium]|nr:dihydropteroate synthase [Deltaproteobacteria bacterium]
MSHRLRALLQEDRPLIMGILNLTPDSFSDGKPSYPLSLRLLQAEELVEQGADIIDIGGESTRPQADAVSLEEERQRVLPFLQAFRNRHPEVCLSLDTKKPALAKEALAHDIDIINDVGFFSDPGFLALVQNHDVHYVLMHSRGDSQSMMNLCDYGGDVVAGVRAEFQNKLAQMQAQGFPFEKLILDLGFGFAKTAEQNIQLTEDLSPWAQEFSFPWLYAISRKRFLQSLGGGEKAEDRDEISAKLAAKALGQGFKIVRTHNPELTRQHLGL